MEDILIQLISSIIIGGAIGFERKSRGKDAGLVTNILVCFGATLISIHQGLLVNQSIALIRSDPNLTNVIRVDNSRLIAQIISGIGFLGGGVIIQSRGSIKGITTAATLWVVAGIGIVIGSGNLILGYISGTLVLLSLIIFKKIEIFTLDEKKTRKIYLEYYESEEVFGGINRVLNERGITISHTKIINRIPTADGVIIKKLYSVHSPKYVKTDRVLTALIKNKDIIVAKKY